MKHLRYRVLFAMLLASFAATRAHAQDRVFNWQRSSDQTVRLDPANYYTGESYGAGSDGAQNHVDIHAQKPVTIFLAPVGEWRAAFERPESLAEVRRFCLREHVVDTTYLCNVPPEPTILVLEDERYSSESRVSAVLGTVLDQVKDEVRAGSAIETGISALLAGERATAAAAPRRFVDPNDVHIQYYHWVCVEYCVQPEFEWRCQVNEKYKLSSFLKVYGGFAPDHDGEQVSIKINSPVPMLVAMLPSAVADQLHGKPEMLEPALERNACQQRGVQSLQFECKFDVSDGPQSLIVVPEQGQKVPNKKAEVQMFASRCVANCDLLNAENK
jgi:hypothetical protein